MTTRRSLHIGLNSVNPDSYGGPGTLIACEFDAGDMADLAQAQGYVPETLLTSEASCHSVLEAIARAARELEQGDRFFLTYSGHGGQVPALTSEEDDALDETWCLFDTQLRDDDIHHALAAFSPGVQIIMLSDSCHSGTVARTAAEERDHRRDSANDLRFKTLPFRDTLAEFEAHQDSYAARPTSSASAVRATGVLISGCRDDQESQDGDRNGAFTAALLACWNDQDFAGNLNQLHLAIKTRLRKGGYVQVPQLFCIGPEDESYTRFMTTAPVPW